jgi:hypothetical protein
MEKPARKDFALIIGLLIPVAMILFIGGAIYLPRACSTVDPPAHDFLYLVGYPYGEWQYLVRDGRLVRDPVDVDQRHTPPRGAIEIQFFVHDVAANSSQRISYEAAADLLLDNTAISPDGYSVVHGRKSELFFPVFSTSDYRTRYLRKDGRTLKLDLELGDNASYAYSFQFLGWVVEDADG